jgi:hypothetical protein
MTDAELVLAVRQAGLLPPSAALDWATLQALAARVNENRLEFLSRLKAAGLTLGQRRARSTAHRPSAIVWLRSQPHALTRTLAERLANAIARAAKAPSATAADAASARTCADAAGASSGASALSAAQELEVRRRLLDGGRESAHDFLRSLGVAKLGERQRIVGASLQTTPPQVLAPPPPPQPPQQPPPQRQPPQPPPPPQALAPQPSPAHLASATTRYCSAAEAIAAGQVSLVTLTNSGYLPYTANCLVTLELIDEALPLTVYCADGKSYETLHAHVAARTSVGHADAHVLPMHEEGLGAFLAWKEVRLDLT